MCNNSCRHCTQTGGKDKIIQPTLLCVIEIHNGIVTLGISIVMYGTNVHPNNTLTEHDPSMLAPVHCTDN
jgi:hypothetical protein